jgi:hypothetical protein
MAGHKNLLIQVSNRHNDWTSINVVGGGAGYSADLILRYMESAKNMMPEGYRVRAVDEDGRLIDILN